ncbi:hypothetical protein HK102_012795, partial [Quaeritorhiza haematococci]
VKLERHDDLTAHAESTYENVRSDYDLKSRLPTAEEEEEEENDGGGGQGREGVERNKNGRDDNSVEKMDLTGESERAGGSGGGEFLSVRLYSRDLVHFESRTERVGSGPKFRFVKSTHRPVLAMFQPASEAQAPTPILVTYTPTEAKAKVERLLKWISSGPEVEKKEKGKQT